jgi:hypothetical protein
MYKRPFWHFQPEQEPNNEPEVDNMQVSQPIAKPSVSSSLVCKLIKDGLEQNGVLPAVDMKYRPTASQWQKIMFETEMDPTCSYSNVELINFKTSKVHLKGGIRMPFDCLSEAQYIHVVNGGFYEDAPQIDEKCRV